MARTDATVGSLPVTRTSLLVAALVASTALLVSTGAVPFSDGTDEISEVDIEMSPADGPNGKYAVITENGEIALLLSDDNPDLDGSGIAEDSRTPIHRVFTITNNGTEPARVWIEDDADDVRFYRNDDPGDGLEGPGNELELGPDETVQIGLLVDTRGDHDVADVSQFTVHAEQGTPTPTPEDDDGTDGESDGSDGTDGVDENDGTDGESGDSDGTDGNGSTGEETTPPSVSRFDAANPADQNVSVRFDSDEELSSINVTLRGPENVTLTEADFAYDAANGTYTATHDGSSDGTYTATLQAAADAAGNDGAAGQSDQVTVDTTGPAVTVIEPTNGADYNDSDVALTVSADEPISNWSYSVDGAASQSFSPNATLTGLSEGRHSVTVYAEDDAGNVGSDTVEFAVDTTTPTIPDDSFTATNPAGQNVAVTFNSTERLWRVNVTLRGPENVTLTDFRTESVNGTYTYAATYDGSSDGTYTATLHTAADAVGNDGALGQNDTVEVDTAGDDGGDGGDVAEIGGFEVTTLLGVFLPLALLLFLLAMYRRRNDEE
ncbi:PKD domain-containing protein [Halapricum desulfuricans]|uniref:Putative membrane protein n=1 Tax=Halapricum desulfuricans TaxID=2841257 RepID=A0A897N0D0_9EURY|nr:PKD domain-containing protein [Halapricum desulfuricans]QSG06144.1 putative membrane protein [Halapricum desulfuricans]